MFAAHRFTPPKAEMAARHDQATSRQWICSTLDGPHSWQATQSRIGAASVRRCATKTEKQKGQPDQYPSDKIAQRSGSAHRKPYERGPSSDHHSQEALVLSARP
jgi:hypothetical protein